MSQVQAFRSSYAALIVLAFLVAISSGCVAENSRTTDADAAEVARGPLKFARGLHSLRFGDHYVYRDTSQSFLLNDAVWAPTGDEKLAERLNWCDTSPNPDVIILRCVSGPVESYRH